MYVGVYQARISEVIQLDIAKSSLEEDLEATKHALSEQFLKEGAHQSRIEELEQELISEKRAAQSGLMSLRGHSMLMDAERNREKVKRLQTALKEQEEANEALQKELEQGSGYENSVQHMALLDEMSVLRDEHIALKEKHVELSDEAKQLRKLNSKRVTQTAAELQAQRDEMETQILMNRQVDTAYQTLQVQFESSLEEIDVLRMQNAVLERQLTLSEAQAKETAKDAINYSIELSSAEDKLKSQEKSFARIAETEAELASMAPLTLTLTLTLIGG